MDHDTRMLFAIVSLIAIFTLVGVIVILSADDGQGLVTGFAIVEDGYRDCLRSEEDKCINQALEPAIFEKCLEDVPDKCK